MAEAPRVYKRYIELDACRGIAIVMMVIFHLVFDLSFFSLYAVDTSQGFWRFFGYATASLFVFIAGTAVSLRAEKIPSGIGIPCGLLFIRRGLFLVGVGFLVTLATFIFLKGEGYVIFGILQLIGTSTILAPLFFRLKKWVVIPGIFIIVVGWMITLPTGPLWLLWAGIHPVGFFSVDYTPLLPWFGVFLIGMAAGTWLYPGGIQAFQAPYWVKKILRIPAIPGRHSLLIYLIHQPVLLLLLTLFYGSIPGM